MKVKRTLKRLYRIITKACLFCGGKPRSLFNQGNEKLCRFCNKRITFAKSYGMSDEMIMRKIER